MTYRAIATALLNRGDSNNSEMSYAAHLAYIKVCLTFFLQWPPLENRGIFSSLATCLALKNLKEVYVIKTNKGHTKCDEKRNELPTFLPLFY